MPRKSARTSLASAPRSSSKRAAPSKATPKRQSKRTKSTPTKSSYFEHDSDFDDEEPPLTSSDEVGVEKASDFEEYASDGTSDESDHEGEETSEDDVKPKKKTPKSTAQKQASIPMRKKHADEKELWKPGAKLPEGTQLIIKKPKARDAGDTPYTPDTIHPNTFLFLKDLAANNDRQWLKMHDPDYRTSWKDFTDFLECLSEKVIEIDETIPELPVKDIIFRIYRDIRFTSDPTPYKAHFSAAWSRTGRKGPYAAYYVQVKPNSGSFVGGGLWCPPADSLSRLRRDIDRKPHKIKSVLTDAKIRKAFLGGIGKDEKKAVRAFVNQSENASTALKTKPKGYENDHKDIQLLRLKNFTMGKKLADDEVIGDKGLERIAELISCMVPFITYLNSVVMPDEESSDSSSDEEDGAEEDGESSGNGVGEEAD